MSIEKNKNNNENKFEDNLFKLLKNDDFKKLINNAVDNKDNFDFQDLKEESIKTKEQKKGRKENYSQSKNIFQL